MGRRCPAATVPACLGAFAARGSRFVGRPFVGGALDVGRAAALAGDLALLLRRHRCESASLLASWSVHRFASVLRLVPVDCVFAGLGRRGPALPYSNA